MSRQKGLAKTGGRKQGTPNKTSEEVRLSLLKLLADNLETLQTDIAGMKPKDRAYLLITLAKHCTAPAINPEKLTQDQLLQIITYLREHEEQS